MATMALAGETRGVSIGRVIQRAFGTITGNPLVTLGLAFVLGGLPSLILRLVRPGLVGVRPGTTPGAFGSAMWETIIISSLLGIVLFGIIQGALVRATVAHSEGREASFAECISVGLRAALPVIGLMILWYFASALGFLLLFVPGVILVLMWSVAIPALVEERTGIIAAFGRSRFLTRGERWKILGLLLVVLAVYLLLLAVVGLLGYSVFKQGATDNFSAGALIGNVLFGTLQQALWGTMQSSLFVELREAKEGSSVGNLRQVFA